MTEQNNKHGLGRGLEALFGDDDLNIDLEKLTQNSDDSVSCVKIEDIIPCRFQPRKNFTDESLNALAESVKEKGILQPLLVRKKENKFEIVAGERRYRAALKAGLKEVPVIYKELNDNEAFEIALIENVVRENLTPIEEAFGFERLMKSFNYTHEELSKIVGKSRSYITNILRLLNLPKDVRKFVDEGQISVGHARALVGFENALTVAEKIVKNDLSVRQTENLINQLKNKKSEKTVPQKQEDVLKIEKELSEKLKVKVDVKFNAKGKGKIILNYKDFSELENLLDKLEH